MAFIALDGFAARLEASVKSTDDFVRIRKADAAPLLTMGASDYTWLLLRDRINREVVKVSDIAGIVDVGKGLIDLPVSRLVVSGIAYNFSCHSVLAYAVTTPVVREVVSATLQAQGIV